MKTIAEILKDSASPLTKLINKAEASQTLKMIFQTALDPNMAKHCHFANYKNSALTITVTNTSWATRLRFAIPDIIKQLQVQPEFKDITSIRYVITTPQAPVAKAKIRQARISPDNEIIWKKTLAELGVKP